MKTARAALAGCGFQLRLVAHTPDTLQVILTAPMLTVVFLAITENAGRADLAAYGVVAPTLISLWTVVLLFAGEIISEERAAGTLEGLVAAPVSLSVLVVSRLLAVSMMSVVAFAEAWLVAGIGFDRWINVAHPWLFALVLMVTAVAVAGTASVLSPLFVLLPSARIVQNSLSYPFYLLGGVVVPVALLPEWIQPASRVVFLSWASDLLRDALAVPQVRDAGGRLLVLLLLGAAGFVVGSVLLQRVLLRVRRTGTLVHS